MIEFYLKNKIIVWYILDMLEIREGYNNRNQYMWNIWFFYYFVFYFYFKKNMIFIKKKFFKEIRKMKNIIIYRFGNNILFQNICNWPILFFKKIID